MSTIKTPEVDIRDVLIEGSIIAWIPGYFGNGSNGSYTRVLGTGDDVTAANAYLNPRGYYVCDGAPLNDSDSTIFNGAGRYLPNLTDDRFLMGDTVAGGIGGSNTLVDHTHGVGNLAAPAHTHSIEHNHGSVTSGYESANHTHDFTATGGEHYHQLNKTGGVGTSLCTSYNSRTNPTTDRVNTYTQGSHTHTGTTAGISVNHTHTVDLPNFTGTSGGASSTTLSGTYVGSGSAATSTESRPKYLSVFYIMKIK